jgi:PAS domain S-box-containing protein
MLGIFQLDTSGIFLFINDAFLNIVGYSRRELIGHPFRMLIDPDDWRAIESLRKVFDTTSIFNQEFPLKHKDGHRIDAIIRAISIQLNDQRIINGFISDITEQKQMENELRASEQRYRTLAETARDLIILIARDGQITYINSFAADYVGLKSDQLIGQHYTMFFPKESLKSLSPAIDSVFGTSTALRLEEKIRFSSKEYWLSLSIVPLIDSSGELTSVFILAKDISDLKKSELALQREKKLLEKRVLQRTASLAASQDRSRKLARQVVTAQEVERRRVARELHDQAGQALISIKYEMDLIYKDLNIKSKPARQRFLKMMTLIDQTTGQIREISQNLHPPILDIAGLNLSIKEYCTELAKRTSLVINYNGCELPGLPDEIGINLFRILQELLTNILKHSQATSVTVQLDYRNEVIVFSVKDNGRGIDNKSSNKGLGLVGIHERVDILGGDLKIHSLPGHGTEITISIPWKSAHIHSGQPDQDPV